MNVELKLWLKDLVSGSLKKIEATTRAAFGGIDKGVTKTAALMNNAAGSVNDLNKKLDDLRKKRDMQIDMKAIRDANREIERLEERLNHLQTAGTSRGGGRGAIGGMAMGSFIGNLGAQAAMMAGGMVKDQVTDVLSSGLEAGAMQAQYKVLAGDMEGAKLYGDIKKYVADSVFGPELYENGRTMMAFGIQAKDVMTNMKMLGDVAMGDKEKMDLLTLAFSQTTSAGRLMGQDLLQYVNAGFNPLMVLAERTGQKYEDLKDQMSAGKISAEQVKQAFVLATSEGGKYNGMLKKMEKTPYGKLQAMQGSISDAKTGLGVALAPAVSKLLEGLKPMVDGLPRMLERLVPVMERMFGGITDMLPAIERLGSVTMEAVKPVMDLLLSGELSGLAKELIGLTTDMLGAVKPFITDVAKGLKDIAPVITEVVKDVRAFGGALKTAYDWINSHTPHPGGQNAAGRKELATSLNAQFAAWMATKPKKNTTPAVVPGTMAAVGLKPADKATGMPSAPEKDAITGGGQKVVNIYLNKPIVEKQVFNVANMQEAMEVGLNEFRENYLRVLQAAVAAL